MEVFSLWILIISQKSNKLLFVSKWRKAKKMIAKIWIPIFWVPETRLSHSIKRGEFTIRKNVVGLNDYSNPPTDTRQGFFFAATILISQSNFFHLSFPCGHQSWKREKSYQILSLMFCYTLTLSKCIKELLLAIKYCQFYKMVFLCIQNSM